MNGGIAKTQPSNNIKRAETYQVDVALFCLAGGNKRNNKTLFSVVACALEAGRWFA